MPAAGKPIFLYDNLLKKYAITVTSEASGYPKANLCDDDINSLWKGTSSADQTIKIDAGAGNVLSPDVLFIGNHNIATIEGTILLQGSSDNFVSDIVTVIAEKPSSDQMFHALPRLIVNGSFGAWTAGASAAPNGWTLFGAGASVARDSSNYKDGPYGVALTYGSAAGYLAHDDPNYAYYKGKTVSFGCWVKSSVANHARLAINDGPGAAYSPYHTGGGGWEWLSVSRTIDANATQLSFRFRFEAAGTSYFDVAVAREGGSAASTDLSDLAQPVSKRYWRVGLGTMVAVPQIGEAAFGSRFTLPRWFAEGFDDLDMDVNKKTSRADGGQKETIKFYKRKVFPCAIKNIAVGTQAETDLIAWKDTVEDGMPFWMLYDLRGAYVPVFVSVQEDRLKAPISGGMRRDFSFTLEEEL